MLLSLHAALGTPVMDAMWQPGNVLSMRIFHTQGSKDTLHRVTHGTELLRPYVARVWSAMHDPFAAHPSLPSRPRASWPCVR